MLEQKPSLPAAEIATPGACNAAWPEVAPDSQPGGTVELAILVTENGKAGDVKVVKSSKSRALDKASLQAVARCTFVPVTVNGVVQMSWATLKYDWVAGQPAVPHN